MIILKNMFLKRRMVVILEKLNDRKEYPTKEEFLDFFLKKRWPRWNYCTLEIFLTKLKKDLEYCIGPDRDRHFIDYFEDEGCPSPRQKLKVTALGRDLIKRSYFPTFLVSK